MLGYRCKKQSIKSWLSRARCSKSDVESVAGAALVQNGEIYRGMMVGGSREKAAWGISIVYRKGPRGSSLSSACRRRQLGQSIACAKSRVSAGVCSSLRALQNARRSLRP